MNTFAVNSAPCMRMTASLTSSSAAGMAVTGNSVILSLGSVPCAVTFAVLA